MVLMVCRNFSGAQLQWESVASNTTRCQATSQQQQLNHANHSQSKAGRIHADDQSDVKLVGAAYTLCRSYQNACRVPARNTIRYEMLF